MQNKKLSTFSLRLFPDDSILSNTSFVNLWLTQMLTQVGVKLFDFVLAIQIYRQTGSNASVAYLILSYGLPALLFSSLAGVLVDKWRKKTTLILINIIRFTLVVSFIPLHSNFFVVIIFAFLLSTVSQFFTPVEAVLIPRIVNKKHLITANSFFTLTVYSSAVFGFMGAGPLLKSMGDTGAFVIISTLFLFATFLSFLLPIESKSRMSHLKSYLTKKKFIDPINAIKQGYEVVSKIHGLKIWIFLLVVSQIMVAMFMSLTPGLATRVLQLHPEDASVYLVGPAAFGMVVGALLISRIGNYIQKPLLVKIGLLGSITVFICISLFPEIEYLPFSKDIVMLKNSYSIIVGLGIIFSTLAGFFNSFVSISCNTFLQENTGYRNRGKLFGFIQSIVATAGALPILLSGVLADIIGVTKVFGYLAISIMVVLLLSNKFMKKNEFDK